MDNTPADRGLTLPSRIYLHRKLQAIIAFKKNKNLSMTVIKFKQRDKKIPKNGKNKTYNTGDSLVVTDPTTSPALRGLCLGERTGPSVFHELWSYVIVYASSRPYNRLRANSVCGRGIWDGVGPPTATGSCELCLGPIDSPICCPRSYSHSLGNL